MLPEDNLPTLLVRLQQICRQIAACPIRQTEPEQLKRDLSTLKGHIYLAEMQIEQTEIALQAMKPGNSRTQLQFPAEDSFETGAVDSAMLSRQ